MGACMLPSLLFKSRQYKKPPRQSLSSLAGFIDYDLLFPYPNNFRLTDIKLPHHVHAFVFEIMAVVKK
jgi:hypothetical protein